MALGAIDAITMVLTEARRYVGIIEQPPGSNRGTEIDYWVREAGLNPAHGYPWCSCFVGQAGRQALGYAWPCPRTASVMSLVAWAQPFADRWFADPQPGDLFVLWEVGLTPPRFGHVGFVERVIDGNLFTIEGNTNGGASTIGYGVFTRTRLVTPTTRYIRWTAALSKEWA